MAKLQRAWHTTVIATYQLYQLHKYAVHTYVHYIVQFKCLCNLITLIQLATIFSVLSNVTRHEDTIYTFTIHKPWHFPKPV